MITIVSGALGWFLSCPTVLQAALFLAALLAAFSAIIGYAVVRGE